MLTKLQPLSSSPLSSGDDQGQDVAKVSKELRVPSLRRHSVSSLCQWRDATGSAPSAPLNFQP